MPTIDRTDNGALDVAIGQPISRGFGIWNALFCVMQTAAIILALAALGGLTLAVVRFRGTPYPPTWMALGHGLVAATGLGFLGYAAYYPGIPQLGQIALGILVVAALGGATLFLGFHLRKLALPIPLVVIHGLLAATGYVTLLVTILRPA